MKKETKLRRRAKEMRELGENRIAAHLERRADQLEKKGKTPDQVVLYEQDGRIYIQPPNPGHPKRAKALAFKLKEAAGNGNYEWLGKSFKKDDPRRGLWSFKSDHKIVSNLLKVLGDFFSRGKVVNEEGEFQGYLPESTYQG